MLEFRDVCVQAANPSATGPTVDTLHELGRLMNESHKSCSELCESSCHELDVLVKLAKEAGAYGSRVTGASELFIVFIEQRF